VVLRRQFQANARVRCQRGYGVAVATCEFFKNLVQLDALTSDHPQADVNCGTLGLALLPWREQPQLPQLSSGASGKRLPKQSEPLGKRDAQWIIGIDVGQQAILHLSHLGLKCAKQSVPNN